MAESKSSQDNTTRMYFLVNQDLKMGKGKLCGQCSHATAMMTRVMERMPTETYREWSKIGETKIILKSTQEMMEMLLTKYRKKIRCFPVYDAGLSQVPEGSFTVLAFEPLRPKDIPTELHTLKLL